MSMPRLALMMSCVAFVGTQAPAATQKPSLEPDVGCHVGLLDICSVQRKSPTEALRVSLPTSGSASARMQRLDSFLLPPFVADVTGFGAMTQNLIQFGQALFTAFEAAERSVQLSSVPGFAQALAQLNNPAIDQAFVSSAPGFLGSPADDFASFPTAIDQSRFASAGGSAAGGGTGSGGFGGTGAVATAAAGGAPATASGGGTSSASASGNGVTSASTSGTGGASASGSSAVAGSISADGSPLGGIASASTTPQDDPLAGLLPSALGFEEAVDTLLEEPDTLLSTAEPEPGVTEEPEATTAAAAAGVAADLPAVPLPLSGALLLGGLGAMFGFRKKS